MYEFKKIPSIMTAIVLLIIILISAFEKAALNVLSMRIIIFGIIFYLLGIILENFLNSVIREIEKEKLNVINEKEDNLQKSDSSDGVDAFESENSYKESENQSEKISNDTEEKA